jgi:hypothetical protein
MILAVDAMGSCSSAFSPVRYSPDSASMSAQAWASSSGGSGAALLGVVVWAPACCSHPAPSSTRISTSISITPTGATTLFVAFNLCRTLESPVSSLTTLPTAEGNTDNAILHGWVKPYHLFPNLFGSSPPQGAEPRDGRRKEPTIRSRTGPGPSKLEGF